MRLAAFLTLLFIAPIVPPSFMLLFGLLYCLLWEGYELLLLSFCLDAFFGVGAAWPVYTLGAGCLLVLIEWIKPQLSFYTTE